jgi:hypothetical protein
VLITEMHAMKNAALIALALLALACAVDAHA